jgi:hypothetical protein
MFAVRRGPRKLPSSTLDIGFRPGFLGLTAAPRSTVNLSGREARSLAGAERP